MHQLLLITQVATDKRVLPGVLTRLHHLHWRHAVGRPSGRTEWRDLYLTGMAPKHSVAGACLAGEMLCLLLLLAANQMRREKKLASDVLILFFRIQKLLPPNTSHLGNNSQAKDGKFLQDSAIDRVMVAKTLP